MEIKEEAEMKNDEKGNRATKKYKKKVFFLAELNRLRKELKKLWQFQLENVFSYHKSATSFSNSFKDFSY